MSFERYLKDDAKKIIEGLLKRLNSGEGITAEEFEQARAEYIPA